MLIMIIDALPLASWAGPKTAPSASFRHPLSPFRKGRVQIRHRFQLEREHPYLTDLQPLAPNELQICNLSRQPYPFLLCVFSSKWPIVHVKNSPTQWNPDGTDFAYIKIEIWLD
jgi:hypothetical protein